MAFGAFGMLAGFLHAPLLATAFSGAPLQGLIQQCAVGVGPVTMKAIVDVESGGDSLAINDDTARRSYRPATYADAVALARNLQAIGHNFDAGIAQVNSDNFPAQGLDGVSAFDPCRNLAAGARILSRSYAAATKLLWIGHAPRDDYDRHRQEQLALWHAFSIYNSGSAWRSTGYANMVVSAALRHPFSYSAAAAPYIPRAAAYQPPAMQAPSRARTAAARPGFVVAFHSPAKPAGVFLTTRRPSVSELAALARSSSISPTIPSARGTLR